MWFALLQAAVICSAFLLTTLHNDRLLKERAAEDHLFGDKDKFVTAAYKKKLEEDQKWLAAERIREARDAKADVVKAGHMGNFYRSVFP